MKFKSLIFLILTGIVTPALGEAPLTYDRVHLQGQASREVANDLLVAQLYVQRDGQNASQLAAAVNQEIAWAVETAKREPAIVVQTEGYQTSPVYDRERLTGWRVRQSLRLESRDAGRLGDLLGTLQQRIALQAVGYEISSERLREAGDALLLEALAAFRARADMISKAFGASGYRLVEVQVGDAGGPPPRPYLARTMEMSSAAVPAPALEPGSREITITASGVIELQRQ